MLMFLHPIPGVRAFDKDGRPVDLAGLIGRQIKWTREKKDGSVVAVIDQGPGVPGLPVRFLSGGDYARCRLLERPTDSIPGLPEAEARGQTGVPDLTPAEEPPDREPEASLPPCPEQLPRRTVGRPSRTSHRRTPGILLRTLEHLRMHPHFVRLLGILRRAASHCDLNGDKPSE